MNTTVRQVSERRRPLACLQGTDRLPCSPGPQHYDDELRRNTLRKSDRSSGGRSAFGGRIQLAEAPGAAADGLAEREFAAVFPRDLSPAFVKHCQFGNAAIASAASANADANPNIGRTARLLPAPSLEPRQSRPRPKHQTPNTKHQTTSQSQHPRHRHRIRPTRSGMPLSIASWDLDLDDFLE